MEAIPNKITDTMGIVADINLLYEGKLQYIEIIVDKYPSLISYYGKYFYRFGSTMRTMTGKKLDKAILKSQGRTWDGMPIPKLQVTDLRREAFDLFKEKALRRHRLTEEETRVDDVILVENLHLFNEEGYLIRAAMLAFYKDPEKWVTGSYIKIGYFGDSDSDLKYQDEVHGSLIEQIDKAVDLVYTKYLKALIYYEGIQRIEQFMFPQEAFREILLNAVVHKNYKEDVPVEIRVYLDQIQIINFPGPDHYIDMEKFAAGKVRARRYRNPKIGEFFKEIDLSEKKSTGISKILRELIRNGSPLPEFETHADRTYMISTIKIHKGFEFEKENFGQKNDRSLTEVLTKKNYEKVLPIVEFLDKNREITPQIAETVLKKSKSTTYRYLSMLVGTGYVEVSGNTNNAVYKVVL